MAKTQTQEPMLNNRKLRGKLNDMDDINLMPAGSRVHVIYCDGKPLGFTTTKAAANYFSHVRVQDSRVVHMKWGRNGLTAL